MKFILCLCLGLLALLPVHGMDQSCGNTQCIQNAVCSSSGSCTCDTSKGFAAGNTGDIKCSCAANRHLRYSDGKCAKNVGQTCSSSSECGDYNVCDTTCKCDVSKNLVLRPEGLPYCMCDNSKAVTLGPGPCLLRAGQPCTATSDCPSDLGMTCVSGTCGCDTSKNFRTAIAGTFNCDCADNYRKKHDGTCGKLEGQACTADDTCVDHATCTSGICTCDATSSSSVGGLCECTAGTHHIRSDKTCGKVIGQTCSADGQCIDHAACVGGKCKCDATLNRNATTADGATQCRCDGNFVEINGVCYKTVGQPCNDVSECIGTTGMVCQDVSGTKKCTCDTNKNYAAGSDGDIMCNCAANYSNYLEPDGTCVLRAGQACNANSACVQGTVCDKVTSTCVCDTANNYKSAVLGLDDCECADNTVTSIINGTRSCGKKVGGTCNPSIGAIVCTTNTESTENRSSNSVAGLFVPLTVLVTGLLMTLIPI